MKISRYTSPKPTSPARQASIQDDRALPFGGLGFDLSAVLSRPITPIRREAPRLPTVPGQGIDMPVPAGRLLLVRLNREIRGS
ncbi:MAG: hypothetical protein EOL86_03340 [Deltaproteobacteria bacterium]|nr:hypothetical protein [Deltaproteobacteria bacterium]